jgi:dephospho-CoA kinase
MILLGLTGSIGMGKSTTAQMFADEGAVVWNADEAVHKLYSPGGAAVEPVGEAFPGVVIDGAVDRTRLAEALGRDDAAFKRLEAIVHPLVAAGRAGDLAEAAERGVKLAVLDIPLLFEGGGGNAFHAVVVVTADATDPGRTGPRPSRHDPRPVRGHSGAPDPRRRETPSGRLHRRDRQGSGGRARSGAGDRPHRARCRLGFSPSVTLVGLSPGCEPHH